jgi:hypothetical protein
MDIPGQIKVKRAVAELLRRLSTELSPDETRGDILRFASQLERQANALESWMLQEANPLGQMEAQVRQHTMEAPSGTDGGEVIDFEIARIAVRARKSRV